MSTSLEGYAADLRRLAPGDKVVRMGYAPLGKDAPATLDAFRRAVTATNAREGGGFSIQTLDTVSDDFRHVVRVIITTRTA